MRNRWALPLAFAIVAILIVVTAITLTAGVKWEYRIVAVPDGTFDVAMNALGREGWELVTARRASDGSSTPTFSYEVILKRHRSTLRALSEWPARAFAARQDRAAREARLSENVILDKFSHTFHRPTCILPTPGNSGGIMTARAAIAAGWRPSTDCNPLEP
jgi:hypothetical protein